MESSIWNKSKSFEYDLQQLVDEGFLQRKDVVVGVLPLLVAIDPFWPSTIVQKLSIERKKC